MKQDLFNITKITLQEYATAFSQTKKEQHINWEQVESKLQNEMEWSKEGATRIASLTRQYGEFVLRNALALAISLGIEDGELGY